MPRMAQIDKPALRPHVMVRDIEGQKIFRYDADRENFLSRLCGSARRENGLEIGWPTVTLSY